LIFRYLRAIVYYRSTLKKRIEWYCLNKKPKHSQTKLQHSHPTVQSHPLSKLFHSNPSPSPSHLLITSSLAIMINFKMSEIQLRYVTRPYSTEFILTLSVVSVLLKYLYYLILDLSLLAFSCHTPAQSAYLLFVFLPLERVRLVHKVCVCLFVFESVCVCMYVFMRIQCVCMYLCVYTEHTCLHSHVQFIYIFML
jgi:hypothetical protein